MSLTRNIKLTIAYDGTAYHGFQRQANALTVQQALEERLSPLFGHPLKIIGAGRTDAGVHAWGQVVHFLTTGSIPAARIVPAAKSVLPADMAVWQAEEVPTAFHARYSAQSKIYVYRILPTAAPDPFQRNYAWQVAADLDVAAMHAVVQLVTGTHDFSAFRAAGGPPVDPVRNMLAAECRQREGIIEVAFWGTGFLYHMVRNLVGTLFDVGAGKLDAAGFQNILEGCDRTKAGITAPAQGLYLKEILYNGRIR